jgi:hypothetical protein
MNVASRRVTPDISIDRHVKGRVVELGQSLEQSCFMPASMASLSRGTDAMVSEVIAGLGAFKTLFDIAKSINDLDDTVKRNAAVANLWEQIIAAQQRYTAALEQVDTLKEELARFETWDAEKEKCELKAVNPGAFAYVPKPNAKPAEPNHWLCTSCFGNRKKSILQRTGPASGGKLPVAATLRE